MNDLSSKQQSPLKQSLSLAIFTFFFVVLGLFIILLGIRDLIRAKASLNWPTTQGKVVTSTVKELVEDYQAQIIYKFSVNGITFLGDRIAYGVSDTFSQPCDAYRMVRRYPKGNIVTVYYMPDLPTECLLEPGLKFHSWGKLIAGFFLIIWIILFLKGDPNS